jgi:diguanylate cyclase (GGDEF)-like protein
LFRQRLDRGVADGQLERDSDTKRLAIYGNAVVAGMAIPALNGMARGDLLADLGEMIEQEIKSIQLATLDDLTMISNRRGFMTLVDHSLKVCRRNKLPISIVLFDLDKFKAINDAYGHHEGDFVLVSFARIMLASFRDCDVIARQGGDEFVVMLLDSDAERIGAVLERFRLAIEEANIASGKPYRIEYSVGVAHFPHDTDEPIEKMLQIADDAMCEHKNQSRGDTAR